METYKEGTHFIERRQIQFCDCDRQKNLRLSSLLRLMGEHAGEELYANGVSHQQLWDEGMVFLLTRISVKIHRLPREKDWITHHTWVHSTHGALFYRPFSMLDENGEVYLDAMSAWVLVNPKTRRVLRPKEYHYGFDMDTTNPPQAPMPGKIEIASPTLAGERQIRYSDIDANGHLYNAIYGDIICDFAPLKALEHIEQGISSLQINFIHEAKLGDTLEIFYEQDGNEWKFLGNNSGKPCFEAVIE